MKNEFYTPQNFLAKLPDGRIVSIDDYIKNGITDDITCPCCNSKLTLRAKDSIHMQPHFKHENGESCLDYTKSKSSDRKDNFYRREMELTEQEVENYKKRIEGLEYIYEFVKRIKNEVLTPENQKEFLTALSHLDYDDQLWVFNYAKNSSCLKPLKYEMANTINKNALAYLNEKYSDKGIVFENRVVYKVGSHYTGGYWSSCHLDETRIVPHEVEYTLSGNKHYTIGKNTGSNPLIFLDSNDIKSITTQVDDTINYYKIKQEITDKSKLLFSNFKHSNKYIQTEYCEGTNSLLFKYKDRKEKINLTPFVDRFMSDYKNFDEKEFYNKFNEYIDFHLKYMNSIIKWKEYDSIPWKKFASFLSEKISDCNFTVSDINPYITIRCSNWDKYSRLDIPLSTTDTYYEKSLTKEILEKNLKKIIHKKAEEECASLSEIPYNCFRQHRTDDNVLVATFKWKGVGNSVNKITCFFDKSALVKGENGYEFFNRHKPIPTLIYYGSTKYNENTFKPCNYILNIYIQSKEDELYEKYCKEYSVEEITEEFLKKSNEIAMENNNTENSLNIYTEEKLEDEEIDDEDEDIER